MKQSTKLRVVRDISLVGAVTMCHQLGGLKAVTLFGCAFILVLTVAVELLMTKEDSK